MNTSLKQSVYIKRKVLYFLFMLLYFKNQGEQQPTPCSSYLKELKVTRAIKKYPAFRGSQRLTNMFTTASAIKVMFLSTLPTNTIPVPHGIMRILNTASLCTHLQWTRMGPFSSEYTSFILLMNLRIPAGCSGAMKSFQTRKWYCTMLLSSLSRSLFPLPYVRHIFNSRIM